MSKNSKTNNKIINKDYIVAAFLLFTATFFALMLWSTFRYLPFAGTSAQNLIPGAKIFQQRGYRLLTLTELGSSQPPLASIFLHLNWQIFGESLPVTHAFAVPFLILLVFSSTFSLAKLTKSETAIFGGLIIAIAPVVVATFANSSALLISASLTTTSFAFWIYNKPSWAIIPLSLSSLIYPASSLVVVFYAVDSWQNRRQDFDRRVLLIPFVAVLIWYLYHQMIAGWWLLPGSVQANLPTLNQLVNYSWFTLKMALTGQYRWLITLPAILTGAFLVHKKTAAKQTLAYIIALLSTLTIVIVWFSIQGNYQHESFLPFIPILTIVSLKLVHDFFSEHLSDWQFLLPIILVIIGFVNFTNWRSQTTAHTGFSFRHQENLNYQDFVNLYRQTATYLEATYFDTQIYSGVPLNYQLTQPFQGFVSRPLDFQFCQNFQIDSEKPQIIVMHTYHPSMLDCAKIIKTNQFQPVHTIKQKDKTIQIFSVTATNSASLEN